MTIRRWGQLIIYFQGFFKPDQAPSRTSTSIQPYSAPQGRAHNGYMDAPVEYVVDEEQEDRKLQKVLYALSDLVRTPSDHAQLRAINAIESLATKGNLLPLSPSSSSSSSSSCHFLSLSNLLLAWNLSRMVAHSFVPHIIDLLRSKFVDVQETTARVVATILKNCK